MDEQGGSPGRRAEVDELEQGFERSPWGPGRWMGSHWARLPRAARAVAVALVGAVVGVLVWQGLQPGTGRPSAVPSSTSTVPLSLVLQAQSVCVSYAGDVLQVGFELTNVGRQPVRIVVVRPELPLGMLLVLGSDFTSPLCQSRSARPGAGAVPPEGALAPGAGRPVTFRLVPLVNCAAPAPVQAFVEVGGDVSPATVTVAVLPDLGSVSFPGCATQTG